MAPKFIKPYLKSHKNDFNDAEAIAEAVERPTMRFVSVRSNEQMDLQAVHRIRERLVGERTAVINQIRAFLIEYGLPVKEGRASLRRDLPGILEDAENGLSSRMRQLIASLRDHWQTLEALVAQHTREIELIAIRHDDAAGSSPYRALVHSAPLRWWQPLVTEAPLRRGVSSPPGWVSCRGNTPPAASRPYSASASTETAMSACC